MSFLPKTFRLASEDTLAKNFAKRGMTKESDKSSYSLAGLIEEMRTRVETVGGSTQSNYYRGMRSPLTLSSMVSNLMHCSFLILRPSRL